MLSGRVRALFVVGLARLTGLPTVVELPLAAGPSMSAELWTAAVDSCAFLTPVFRLYSALVTCGFLQHFKVPSSVTILKTLA